MGQESAVHDSLLRSTHKPTDMPSIRLQRVQQQNDEGTFDPVLCLVLETEQEYGVNSLEMYDLLVTKAVEKAAEEKGGKVSANTPGGMAKQTRDELALVPVRGS